MKKVIVSLALVGLNFVLAADIKGTIQSIDTNKKTITVNGTVISVMPYTKIEQDSCGMGWDSAKKFNDLKQGDLVDVDIIYNNNMPVAEDIEIKCMQNRAY